MEKHHVDLSPAEWRKSSRSGGGNNCVEVTDDFLHVVAVRDSKNPQARFCCFLMMADGTSSAASRAANSTA